MDLGLLGLSSPILLHKPQQVDLGTSQGRGTLLVFVQICQVHLVPTLLSSSTNVRMTSATLIGAMATEVPLKLWVLPSVHLPPPSGSCPAPAAVTDVDQCSGCPSENQTSLISCPRLPGPASPAYPPAHHLPCTVVLELILVWGMAPFFLLAFHFCLVICTKEGTLLLHVQLIFNS